MNGKGSKPRPTDLKRYGAGWERVFVSPKIIKLDSMKDYFDNDEFQRCNPPCSKSDMKPDFMRMLNNAREYAGVPFVLNSAYRTVEHELDQGRSGTSSHTKGIAVDIQAATSRARFKIVSGLLRAGFNRIGIGSTFVHVDRDTAKADSVIWHYYD